MEWLILFILISLTSLGLIVMFISLSVAPWAVAVINRNLLLTYLLWFVATMFTEIAPKINVPALPDISIERLIWGLLTLAFFTQVIIGMRSIMSLNKLDVVIIIFCIFVIISKALAPQFGSENETTSMANVLNGFLFPFTMYFFAKHLVDTEKKMRLLILFFIIIGFYLTAIGIAEHYPQFWKVIYPKYIIDPSIGIHWGRARGPFLQAAINGTVITMIFMLSLYLLNFEKRQPISLILSLGLIIMPLAIYFTLTRAVWLGFGLGSLILLWYFPRFRKVFFFAAMVVVVIMSVRWADLKGSRGSEGGIADMNPIYSRIHLLNASTEMFLDRPLLGFGMDTFRFISPDYFKSMKGVPYQGAGLVSHNMFGSILVEMGLLGFIPYVLIFWNLFTMSLQLYRRLPRDGLIGADLGPLFWGISIAFLINMVFIDIRFFLFFNAMYFMIAGIVSGTYQRRITTCFISDKDE